MPCTRASPVMLAASRFTSEGTLETPFTPRTFCATQSLTKFRTSVLGFMLCSLLQFTDSATAGRLLCHAHRDGQARLIAAGADKGSAHRHGLAEISCHHHGDQIVSAHLAVGGIE